MHVRFAPTQRLEESLPVRSLLQLTMLYSVLCCTDLLAQAATKGTAAGGIDHTNLAVIINAADPLSVAAGEYYAKQRHIPRTQVIKVSLPVGSSELSVDDFSRAK